MKTYQHLGGHVIDNDGRRIIPLADALQDIREIGLLAISQHRRGLRAAVTYARGALCLSEAVEAACAWRKAAGWADPFAYDRACQRAGRCR